MWAGAQSTTPSILGPLNYRAEIGDMFQIPSNNIGLSQGCSAIFYLILNIQTPNNASPIKAVNGYLSCDSNFPKEPTALFNGTLIAVNHITSASFTSNGATNGYKGNFNLGPSQMSCFFSADLINADCTLSAVINNLPTVISRGSFFTTPPKVITNYDKTH